MKFLTLVLPGLSGNIVSVSKHWDEMSSAERQAECEPFEAMDSEKSVFPDYCKGFRGTAFQGQMMLLSAVTQYGYGCWCDISNDLRRHSHEPPVNELDSACKTLHHNYNCISSDHFGCDPRTLDASQNEYSLPLAIFAPNADIGQICQNANQNNPCGRDTCLVEASFLKLTYAPIYKGEQYWINMWNDNTYRHEMIGGNFNFYRDCSVAAPTVPPSFGGNGGGNGGGIGGGGNGGGGNGGNNLQPPGFTPLPNQCCGSYPNRKEFSPSFHNCCVGNVESLGSC